MERGTTHQTAGGQYLPTLANAGEYTLAIHKGDPGRLRCISQGVDISAADAAKGDGEGSLPRYDTQAGLQSPHMNILNMPDLEEDKGPNSPRP
jgi:hypothetical protein